MSNLEKKYCLRTATGVNWLIWLEQEMGEYHNPIPMNEVGAFAWSEYVRDNDWERVFEAVANEYDIPLQQAKEDVEIFRQQLIQQGILGEDLK